MSVGSVVLVKTKSIGTAESTYMSATFSILRASSTQQYQTNARQHGTKEDQQHQKRHKFSQAVCFSWFWLEERWCGKWGRVGSEIDRGGPNTIQFLVVPRAVLRVRVNVVLLLVKCVPPPVHDGESHGPFVLSRDMPGVLCCVMLRCAASVNNSTRGTGYRTAMG